VYSNIISVIISIPIRAISTVFDIYARAEWNDKAGGERGMENRKTKQLLLRQTTVRGTIWRKSSRWNSNGAQIEKLDSDTTSNTYCTRKYVLHRKNGFETSAPVPWNRAKFERRRNGDFYSYIIVFFNNNNVKLRRCNRDTGMRHHTTTTLTYLWFTIISGSAAFQSVSQDRYAVPAAVRLISDRFGR